jgi:hypothetical protein
LVFIESLLYPGYFLFLRPNSTDWGSVYVGNGLFDIDLLFELPNINKAESQPQLLNDIIKEKEKREEEERKRIAQEEEEKRRLAEEQEEEQVDEQ